MANKILKALQSQTAIQIYINVLILAIGVSWLNRRLDAKFAKARIETENFITAKKEVYFEAISVINRRMSNLDYPEVYKLHPDSKNKVRNKGSVAPTEFEINACYQKLFLITGDTTIPKLFYNLMTRVSDSTGGYIPVTDMRILLNKIRKDMGAAGEIKSEFPYIISFKGDSIGQ